VATAAAAATTTLKVATGVCLVPQRDPIHTAKEVATVDVLCDGRVILAVGAGWNRQEMRNHGTDPKTRMRLVTERVQAMIEIWTKDEAEYHGQLVNFYLLRAWPKPVQTPYPPIMVGGAGRTVQDRVLAFGDGWAPMIAGIEDDVFDRFARLQDRTANHSSSPPAVPILTAERSRVCGTAAHIGRSCGSPRTPVARSATATPHDSSTTSSPTPLTE
jgi:probable F420-dependent oxidoreductase